MSVTNTLASKIKEDPIIITLREAVGEDSFRRLRDLFEHYSAYSGKMHYMDSFEYNKFMKENGFYSDKVPKIKIDLLFSKKNKAKESIINFIIVVEYPKFVYILYEIARLKRPGVEDTIAINELLKETILTRQNVNYQEKAKFEDWFIELENPSVVDFLNTQSSFFLTVILYITCSVLKGTKSITRSSEHVSPWTILLSSVKSPK